MKSPAAEELVPSVCYMCYSHCPILVRQRDGLVVDIVGHPDYRLNQGKLCAKGKAGIMGLYDPYRLTKPLRRTNPNKGVGVDPRWQQISWEEAVAELTDRLEKVRAEDPRTLTVLGYDFQLPLWREVFPSTFGTPNSITGPANYYCGPTLHLVHYWTKGAFYAELDLDYAKYVLLIGTQQGFMASHDALILARKMAEARARGMRVVVVDPVCGVAGSKADEWVPIRPGTDGALALAMLNVLVNEVAIYDASFMGRYTNGPYLVASDGKYLRDQASGKVLVWDKRENKARPFDAEEIEEFALLGSFSVEGKKATPAFQLLKEHVKKYTPELGSQITTVPAEVIRRLATQLGQAAQIGSTILIDGVELPYRPAAVAWNRGAGAHRHGASSALAIELLNIVLGAVDVPGGYLGNRSVTPLGGPREGPDGLLVPGEDAVRRAMTTLPLRPVTPPETVTISSLFPAGFGSISPMFEEGMLHPEKYDLPYRVQALVHINSNLMLTTSRPGRMGQALAQIPFMASFSVYADETAELADIVFPEPHYLERLVPFPNSHTVGYALASRIWYWPFQQPVSPAALDSKAWPVTLLEVAKRLNLVADGALIINKALRLQGENRLVPGNTYSWEEIVDRWATSWFGPERGLPWFEQAGLITSEKKVQEMYPRIFFKARIPIYYECLIKAGQEVKDYTYAQGISWDTDDYQPLPDWRPCPAFEDSSGEFDLTAMNYRLPFHTFSFTVQNPWLNELAEHHPCAYKVLINSRTAQEKGLRDGDPVWVESKVARLKGQLKVTECIHPDVVAIAGAFGHWAADMPVARGKGLHFNTLLPGGLDQLDTLSGGLDMCVNVKLSRA